MSLLKEVGFKTKWEQALIVGFLLLFLLVILAVLSSLEQASTVERVQISATFTGALGTLLLAIATFINIRNSNRRLELEKKDREKPLVVEELSYLVQPAIEALEANLREFEEIDDDQLAFDWVYTDGPSVYAATRGPEGIRIPHPLPLSRLAADDRELARALESHNKRVTQLSSVASDFHEELTPEIERMFKQDGIDNKQSLKVVSSAVLKDVDHFGDSHELYDFWERRKAELIEYAHNELETTPSDIKREEEEYREEIKQSLESLKQRKQNLKQEYSISENDIGVEDDDGLFDISGSVK